MTTSSFPNVVSPKRIELVDILRGFALFGIIAAHMSDSYFASARLPEWRFFDQITQADQWVNGIISVLATGKFFTIFSFLFGLSFAIQLESAAKKGGNFVGRFSWRLLILLAIGLIHQLFYSGDILGIYVILGFILILFRNKTDKTILIWGLVLATNLPMIVLRSGAIIGSMFQPVPTEQLEGEKPSGLPPAIEEEVSAYHKAVTQGTWREVARFNYGVNLAMKASYQIFSGRMFITLGLFLLGMYAGRKRYFADMETHLPLLQKLFRQCAVIGIPATLVYAATWPSLTYETTQQPWVQLIGYLFMDISNFALTFLYITGLMLLYRHTKAASALGWLAPLGKMGLTTYLCQSLFGTFLFYHYGMGFLGKYGNATMVPIGIAFFAVQIVTSYLWMKIFNNGPIEWLWRCLTYLEWKPLLRENKKSVIAG
jgi:uncharacterized protein